jgi:hypothetical protein
MTHMDGQDMCRALGRLFTVTSNCGIEGCRERLAEATCGKTATRDAAC